MKSRIKSFIVLVSFIFLFAGKFEDPFQWGAQLRPEEVSPGSEFIVEVLFQIPDGHHLYKDKIKLDLIPEEGVRQTQIDYSPAKKEIDRFSGKLLELYQGEALLQGTFEVGREIEGKELPFSLRLAYQGCSDTICYRERTEEIPLILKVRQPDGVPNNTKESGSLLWHLLLAFLGGVLTDLTPCVLPIIPITLAFIGIKRERRRTNLFFTSLFVLAMAFSYAILGIITASLGKTLGFLFQGLPFLIGASLLNLFLAIALLGWIPFQLPLALRNWLAKLGGEGIWGSCLAGATVGFLAAPCVGPIIASLLIHVAQTGNLLTGFLLLFFFGLGMGSLFLVMGVFYHSFGGRGLSGVWTVWAKRVMALLLLLPAGYYGKIAADQIQKSRTTVVETTWIQEPSIAFQKSQAEGKPLFVDFYATWCLPCLEMERGTFNQIEVQDFLRKNFIPLKIDCTTETPTCRSMIEKYQVIGWPTYLVIDPHGTVTQRIVGTVLKPREFLKALEKPSK